MGLNLFVDSFTYYDKSTRQYPKRLFDDILSFSGINKDSCLLEIGAGPGTATDDLRSYRIDLLEVTDEQVEYLKNKYRAYVNITAYKSTFENYEPQCLYDLIYSGTAFHWISPRIAYTKASNLLRKGGTLAPFWNLTLALPGRGVFADLQDIEKKYGLDTVDPFDDYLGRFKRNVITNFDKTGTFEAPVLKEYVYDKSYTAEQYLAWVRSRWYKFDTMESSAQKSFETEVRDIFEGCNDRINIRQYVLLVMARKIERKHNQVDK